MGNEYEYNYLISGISGSGKTYLANKIAENIIDTGSKHTNIYRTVFTNGMTYDDFFGGFKPKSQYDKTTDEWATEYKFILGPFGSILKKAFEQTDENFVLIMEEINRADVYYILGDLFQLLDRKDEKSGLLGESEYQVSIPEAAYHLFEDGIGKYCDKKGKKIIENKLFLPNNFYIIATTCYEKACSNSLDTAFKRRFSKIYLDETGIYYGYHGKEIGEAHGEDDLPVKKCENSEFIAKTDIENARININNIIKDTENQLSDDKLISKHFFKLQKDKDDKEGLYEDVFLTNIIGYLMENVFTDYSTFKENLINSNYSGDFERFEQVDIIQFIKNYYSKKGQAQKGQVFLKEYFKVF